MIPPGVASGGGPPQRGTGGIRHTSERLFGGLLTIFLIEYLRPGNYLPLFDAVKLNTIVPLGVAVMTMLASDGRPNEQVLRAPDTRWLLLFVPLFAMQVFTADVREYVFEIFKGFVGYLLLYYVLVRQVTTLRRLKAVMVTLMVVHVVTLALYPNVVLNPEARASLGGTFLGDGNDFAWSVCIVIPFVLFLAATTERKWVKYTLFVLSVLLVLAVIGTQSRGASLALLAAICYLAWQSRQRVRALAGVATLVVVVLLFAPDSYFERMDTISRWQQDGSAQGRVLAWETATRMALDHPVAGVGAGHYGVKFGFEYKPKGYHGPYLNTHSVYFSILAEFGFPGLTILLGFIIGNLFRNRRCIQWLQRRRAPGDEVFRRLVTTLQASLIAYTVAGAFLSGVFYPHLFVLAGLMESARSLARLGSGVKPMVTKLPANVRGSDRARH